MVLLLGGAAVLDCGVSLIEGAVRLLLEVDRLRLRGGLDDLEFAFDVLLLLFEKPPSTGRRLPIEEW